jgi:hypothetical protein
MKLTTGMFEHRAPNKLGLYANNRRQFGQMAVKNNFWFNQNGERVGNGDLSLNDITKISQVIEKGEIFITILEGPSIGYSICNPSTEYIVKQAHLVITKGHTYFVSGKRNDPDEMKEACDARLPILTRAELAELIKKSEKKKATELWRLMAKNARKFCRNRPINAEMAFLFIFAHRGDVTPGNVFQYRAEETDLYRTSLGAELGIKSEDLAKNGTRTALISEARRLIELSRVEPDPISVLITWAKIDGISKIFTVPLIQMGSSMSEQDKIWRKAYNATTKRSLPSLLEEYDSRLE